MLIGLRPLSRRVRLAVPEDYETLEAIHAEAFPTGWSAHEIEALAAQPGVIVLVATRGSPTASPRPVGFVMARRAADEAEVLTVAVMRRHRRSGIARAMMRCLLGEVLGDSVRRVFLEVDSLNVAAIGLYEAFGFVAVGRRPRYYRGTDGHSSDAVTMALDVERSHAENPR